MSNPSTLQQLWHHFQEGGWAMWPIFGLGLVGVGAAGRFAWRGEHQLLAFVRWLLLTLLACGAFGFSSGMIKVFHYVAQRVAPENRGGILCEGTGEALNNISAGLLFVVVICLLVAIGQRRFPLPNPSAVPR
jgi:hypothetical protein